MAVVPGKYELIKSENFLEYLTGLGLPEEKAQMIGSLKPVYDIKQDGDKIIVEDNHGNRTEVVLNKEVDEKLPFGFTVKTTAVREGDTLVLTSKTEKGRTGKRIHKFSGNEVVITYQDSDAKVPVATRTFKKV